MDAAYDNQFSKGLEITPPANYNQFDNQVSGSGINSDNGQKLYDVSMAQDYAEFGMGTSPSSGAHEINFQM